MDYIANGWWQLGCYYANKVRLNPHNDMLKRKAISYYSTYMRTDGHYNTAPTSAMVPVKLLRLGYTYTWLIPTADTDGDTVRCRWASNTARVPTNIIADECSGICNTFPGSRLNSSTCKSE